MCLENQIHCPKNEQLAAVYYPQKYPSTSYLFHLFIMLPRLGAKCVIISGPGPRPRSRITRTGELSASRIWKVSRYAAPQPLSLTSSPPTSTTHTPVTIPHWNQRSLIIRLSMAHIKRTTSRPSAHKLQTASSPHRHGLPSCTLR